jgi:hypothetical protein
MYCRLKYLQRIGRSEECRRNLVDRSELKSEVRKLEVREQRVGSLECQNVGGRLKTRGELEEARYTKNKRLEMR